MRRAGSYSPRTEESSGEQGFWPSYADMMSAVALILFFLMLLSYVENIITGNTLRTTEDQLENTRAQVLAAQADYDAAMTRFVQAQQDLQGLSDDLDKKQLEIETYEEEIKLYAIQIHDQEDAIKQQEKLIDDQKAYLAAANNEIVAMRSQMQTIAVLRLSILNMIKDSIVEVMGDASKVSIGDNGNIILSESILFDLGSSAVKPESAAVLNELIDVFAAFLSNPTNARYVDSIVISGHTDSTGSDEDNLVLSTDRANSVLRYLLSGKGKTLAPYGGYFCAAGYGETRPVADNSSAAGRAQNRRIEISMILKDESVLDIVDQYLAIAVPDAAITTPAPSASPVPGPFGRQG